MTERKPGRLGWIAVAVGAATLAVHWPALGNGFIDLFDDGPYVLQNQEVLGGLSWHGFAWAVRSVHVHNWHPLTWLSHMADVSLFGLDPRGHHLTSLLLHAANASLVAILFGMLGIPPLAAGLAAAFFGFHPLRLESVAWIAERKDVLSGFLALATLIAWVRFRRRGGRAPYVLALGLFALGLLAKPMLVSLPAVMLLLDAWPLRSIPWNGPGRTRAWRGEARQLAPFVALALAVAVGTLAAQGSTGSIQASDDFPLGMRVANAAISVFAYAAKTIWPSGLSVFYPHPRHALGSPASILALSGLALVTAGAVALVRRAPWLLVGWLWYLVMVFPVLGLLQAGRQGMADRYTYLPTLGLVFAAAWTLSWLAARLASQAARAVLAAACAVACVALAVASREGVEAWRDSESLFLHALRTTGPNSIASNSLGTIAGRRGDLAGAAAHFRNAIEADPRNGIPRQNLAGLLLAVGQVDEARFQAAEAIRLDPANPVSHYLLGFALEQQGHLPEAAAAYEAALRIRPDHVKARIRLGEVRAAMGLPPGAGVGP